ncbi:MAG: transposase [Clostridium sp.]|nr:transposase [Clostridium sp.]
MILVRKLKLTIVNEDENERRKQYKFIRDSQYAQYKGLNKAMNFLAIGFYNKGLDGLKDAKNRLKNSSPIFNDIKFGKGIDTKSFVTKRVKKDFSIDLKNGLAKGERSIRNYKRTFPLLTRSRHLNFYQKGIDIYIKWINNIVFKVVFGSKMNSSQELRHILHKVISEEYRVRESGIEFNKKNILVLNLTLDISGFNKNEMINDRALGVEFGKAIPAYISINDSPYIKKSIGNIEDLLKIRTQMKNRKKRLYRQIKSFNGIAARKIKLKAIERVSEKERNFDKSYNHFISKQVVEFAKDNKCEYIYIEKLIEGSYEDKLLGDWPYFELQNMIEYKAQKENIKVKYVNTKYTFEKCSACGNINGGNRKTQNKFVCKNCGYEVDADYNASQNIARSFDFVV